MTEYCLGFIFDREHEHVLLMRKARPEWQCGKLNGVGGHIEAGETSFQAMARECQEECKTAITSWRQFCVMEEKDKWRVYCYTADVPSMRDIVCEAIKTDEPLLWVQLKNAFIRQDTISNIPWLLGMALDTDIKTGRLSPTISYGSGTDEIWDKKHES